MIQQGAIVVDIGINPVEREGGTIALVGDVDFESVRARAQAVSPVPGGVGPVTDVWVLQNALVAARMLKSVPAAATGMGPRVSDLVAAGMR
jgi:methylenetetrahydrofolate dehydrogenase (NADP+)/methenyltetrahydrofolate cyclohydrolase